MAEDAPAAVFARAQAHYSSTVPFSALFYGEGGEGGEGDVGGEGAAAASGAGGAAGAGGVAGAGGGAEGGGNLHVFLHALLNLAAASAQRTNPKPARHPSKQGAAAAVTVDAATGAVKGALTGAVAGAATGAVAGAVMAGVASAGASVDLPKGVADLPELFERVAARVAHQLSASPQQPGGKGKPR